MATLVNSDDICCPKFDPDPWEDKVFMWHDKPFIKDTVRTLFYMPINYGTVMTRLSNDAHRAQATNPDYLSLADHRSLWAMDLLYAVDKPIDGCNNVILSGEFYSKVYEGSYGNTGRWSTDFQKTVESRGLAVEKLYMWYTTCPKCAKRYGKNYTVIVGKMK